MKDAARASADESATRGFLIYFLLLLYGTIRYHTFGPMLKKKMEDHAIDATSIGLT